MSTLVFFDLDGTILDGISSENAFILHLLKKGRIGPKQIFTAFLHILKWAPHFGKYVFIKNKTYFSGFSTQEISMLAKKFFHTTLKHRIRAKLLQRIYQHKNLGHQLILLTGSPYFLAKEFAKHMGIHETFATEFKEEGGVFSSHFLLQHPFAEEKLAIAKKLCKKYNTTLKESFAYGDSYNDRILLNEVGFPVAVTPKRGLRKIAKNRNWEIIEK